MFGRFASALLVRWTVALLVLFVLIQPGRAQAQDPLLAPFLTSGVDLSGATALVGKTAGEFDVSADGSATYSIPVAVPPGTAGVEPRLSLMYHSKGGDGLVGVGWMLAGLSAITRCASHLVPDGIIDPVDFDSNDRFCLDGQALVPVGDGSYRTEIDSFAKVTWSGGTGTNPQTWTVYTKAGKILEFGGTADSRIEAQGRTDVLVWALDRSQDRSGNFYTVTYGEVNAYGFFAPLRMDYTGNTAAGLAPSNSLMLHYETRTDTYDGFLAGTVVKAPPVRLKQIETFSGSTRVRAYDLSYELGTATSRSRLIAIQECGFNPDATPACLPSTSVEWQDAAAGFDDVSIWTDDSGPGGVAANGNGHEHLGDFNGDGRMDLLYYNGGWNVSLSTGDSFTEPRRWLASNAGPGGQTWDSGVDEGVGDFNGDGRDDYIYWNGGWNVALSNGEDRFGTPTRWLSSTGIGGSTLGPTKHQFFADLNGDGRTDYMYYLTGWGWNVALSDGTRLVPPTVKWLGDSGPGGATRNDNGHEHVADFNADGLPDLMYYNAGWNVALSNGSSLVNLHQWLSGTAGPGSQSWNPGHEYWADFNGDGATDYMYYSGGWNVALSNGVDHFFTPTQWLGTDSPGGGGTANLGHERTADVNGDGLADFLYYSSGWYIALSKGAGSFRTPHRWLASNGGPSGSAPKNDNGHEYAADFDGDGRADHLWFNNNSNIGWVAARQTEPYADLVWRLTDGFGVPIDLEYLPMTTEQVHQPGSGASYPVTDVLGGAQYLLFAAYVPDGLSGGQRTRRFYYGHERRDALRSINLGFEWMREYDEAAGSGTITYYNQDYPIQGTENAMEMYASDDTMRMRTTTTMSSSSTGSGANTISRFFESSRVEDFFEADGSLIVSRTTTSQVDAFDNATVVTSSGSDGYGKTTTATYTNDTANWLIGLPTQVQLVGFAPGVSDVTRTTTSAYDAATGLRTQEVLQPGTALQLSRVLGRDSFGNITSVTTSGSNIETRTESVGYDAKGLYATSFTNALGQSETRTFDARFGVPLSATSINQLTTNLTYDPLGRDLARINPDGTVESVVRAFCADAVVPCPDAGVISFSKLRDGAPPQYTAIDSLSREVRRSSLSFSGAIVHVDTEYDGIGREARRSLPYFDGSSPLWTEFTYDVLDRALTETEPDGSVTAFAYNGLVTAATNSLLQTKTEIRNSQDQLVQATDATGHSNSYQYDPFGNLLSVTDPQNHVTTQAYDALGRRLSLNDPDLGLRTRVYDVLGQLISETDAKNQTRTFQLDKLGRITQFTEADGQTTFTFDTATKGVGQLASVTGTANGQTFTKSFSYDTVGRPSTTTLSLDGRTYDTTAQYDSVGRLSGWVYPGGFTTRNLYNSAGHLSRVENAANGSAFWVREATNAAGESTQELFGNNLRTQRTFDPNTLRVSQIRSGTGTSSGLQNLSYAWDAVGKLTQRSDANRSLTENFQYDSLGRLLQSQVVGRSALAYTYDSIGNLLSKADVGTYTYGTTVRPHAVASTAGAVTRTYTYDANGNETQQLDSGGMLVASLAYTSFDKPSSITATNALGVNASTFRYDERRDVLARTDSPQVGETETIYHAGGGLFEELVRSGGSTEKTHYIAAGGEIVAVYTIPSSGSATLRYLHRDHLGSVDTITDANGTLVESLSYDAFGKRRNPDWTAAAAPIVSGVRKGFTGHEELDNLGLVHMGGRVYDPTLGRFTTADPYVQFPDSTQGLNRYTYVLNNPLTLVDPSGFFSWRKFLQYGSPQAYVAMNARRFVTAFKSPSTIGNAVACYASQGNPVVCAPLFADLAVAGIYGDNAPRLARQIQVGVGVVSALASLPSTFSGWSNAKSAVSSSASFSAGRAATEASAGFSAVLGKVGAAINRIGRAAGAIWSQGGVGQGQSQQVPAANASNQPSWVNPTGGSVRGCDSQGCGGFGVSRDGGLRLHLGTDYAGTAGQSVVAVTDGTVTRIGYPYGDDLSFRYIEIEAAGGYSVREFYVQPVSGLQVGAQVTAGQEIGTLQSLQARYPGITDHSHVSISSYGVPINPTTLIK